MSEPVLRAMRLTVEMWDRVDLVECHDDGVINYHRWVDAIAVNINGGSTRIFLDAFTPEQVNALLPMVDVLSLALRERMMGVVDDEDPAPVVE